MNTDTPCTRLAAALHAACVALDESRREVANANTVEGALLELETAGAPHWTDAVGRHVALAVAALPDSILRAWLMDGRVIGGAEIYQTLKAGATVRSAGKARVAA